MSDIPTLNFDPYTPGGIDLDRLVQSRMLIQANSGGGKSWALRFLLEQTHGRVQQIVLDPEGEFGSLRSELPYLLAGTEGDVPATPDTAALLCRRLMELGASAVIDLYDLKLPERRQYVRRFLEELMHLPRELWRPLLVVIDEAHVFVPERGQGDAESTDAVITLCTQGRKRGFCAVLATQRLSKLHKDAAAELLNKLIGRTGLDVDLKRAADELGLGKESWPQLKTLAPGTFFGYGPAIGDEVHQVRSGEVRTAHPEAGGIRGAAPPPPPDAIRELLAQLQDLPAQADAEAHTVDELRATIERLRAELRERPAPEPVVRIERVPFLPPEVQAAFRAALDAMQCLGAAVEAAGAGAVAAAPPLPVRIPEPVAPDPVAQKRSAIEPSPVARVKNGHVELRKGERRILESLARLHPLRITEANLGVLADLTPSGGTWNSYWTNLRSLDAVEKRDGLVRITTAGLCLLGRTTPAPATTPEARARLFLAVLPNGPKRLFQQLAAVFPRGLTREQLADCVQMTASGGAFGGYLGTLRQNDLITERNGRISLSERLFSGS